MKQYIIYIGYEDKILEYTLPGINDRKIFLNLYGKTGIPGMKISLQVWDEKWFILSNSYVRISQDHREIQEKELEPDEWYNGKIRHSGFRFQIRIGILDAEHARYKKYDLRGYNCIKIGKNAECELMLDEEFVSQYHAVIFEKNRIWYLQDQSSNGTYVNHKKVSGIIVLNPGDQIDIIGFRILFFGNMLAVNRSSSVCSRLMEINIENLCSRTIYPEKRWFSRAPRFIKPFDEEAIEIEGPPGKIRHRKRPLYLTIGPSLTMPIPILMTVLFQVIISHSNGSGMNPLSYFGMAISVTMFAALGIMWTMIRTRYEENVQKEDEENRQQSYQAYIRQNDQMLMEKEKFNRSVLESNYPAVSVLLAGMKTDLSGLWNRNVNHEDFLTVRVGIGSIDSPNQLTIPKQKFSVENDPLVALAGKLKERYKLISHTAKLVDLGEHKIIGIIGKTEFLYRISHTFLVETAALHSYTDVKIVMIFSKGEWEKQWEWVKWLPHTFQKEKGIRFIVNSEESYEEIMQELINEIKQRKEYLKENEGKRKKLLPHYLIFVSDRDLLQHSILYQYMISTEDYGMTFLLFYGELTLLPNECKYIIERSKSFSGIYMLDETIGKENSVQFETVSRREAEEFARMTSGQVIQELGQTEIPESIDYFTLLGIGRIEQWNLLRHYKENRSFEGMKALIGVTTGNKPMYLDIHEKKHGPHGLIAGTTGSGKSETIQTFLLSLALNYHPSEVAFILIDYKGGGMANLFSGIPHVAGMILNLDEDGKESGVDRNQTRRALLSIRSELKRREHIFNQYRVNHIDAYMRLYREGKAKEPLPHLIIISDEFAELKKEQPEFIKELVSTARVGRSIGVHLILATQKPAGVVNDEIVSNSRFKICLKVQDKTDSMEMLKRPEAAYLSTTGRAYLQLGNNELFEMFQSGYSGALYCPRDGEASADDEEVTMINLAGKPCVNRETAGCDRTDSHSQLEVCISYIREQAEKYGISPARPLWLPPLPKKISLQEIKRDEHLQHQGIQTVIGMIDDPERQSRYPLILDFSEFSNLLILGNQGSGKSTLLQTLVYSLVMRYGPDEVNLYAIDLSSGMQRSFSDVPHCGGVAFADDEEKVGRMMQILTKMIRERMKKFSEAGVGSFWEYKKMNQDDMPMVFFLIDNYFAYNQYYENQEENLTKILRNGGQCGVQTIISMNKINDMKYKLRQNINRVLALELSEKMDYVEALGQSPDYFTVSAKGRGLIKTDRVLEFQTALVNNKDAEFDRIKTMEEDLAGIKPSVSARVQKVKVLPVNPIYEEFARKYQKDNGIPIGYEKEMIEPYYLEYEKTYCYLITGVKEKAVMNLMSSIAWYTENRNEKIYYVHLNSSYSLTEKAEAGYQGKEDIYYMLLMLKDEFTKRSQWKKQHGNLNSEELYQSETEEFGRMIILIDDFGQFLELIYEKNNEEAMYPITELFFKQGKGLGIHFFAAMYGGQSTTVVYRTAFKNFISERHGIHIGGHLEQQQLYQFPLSAGEKMKDRADNQGFLMEQDKILNLLIPWKKEWSDQNI